MFDLYTAVVLTAISLLLITMTDVLTNHLIAGGMKKSAVAVCLLIAGALLGEYTGVVTNGASASLITLHKIAKLVEFCCAPAISVAVSMAYGVVRRPKAAIAAAVAHAVFECIALPFGWVFRVDAQNIYHRERLYGVYVAVFVLSVIYYSVCVMRTGKKYQTGIDCVQILTLLLVISGIGIQFINSNVRIDFLCIAIGNMLLYSRTFKIVFQLDAVTCLLNRRCFDVAIGKLDSRAAILFFDINHFKQVNDTYGHSAGDLCLKAVAEQLRNVYGKYGTCYRIGGDEFCVILDRKPDDLEELNGQFMAAVEQLREADARMPDLALGYAFFDPGRTHIQKVIEEADAMMYQNKKTCS
ncbi:MAG: GGDEF domain-containing protein [Butyricicoccus sp.]